MSSSLVVHSVAQFGEKHAVGNMANAFKMSLGGSQINGRFLMGSPMEVGIEWRLDAMRDLTFKVRDCHVSHGDLELDIVKDECYSETVKAEPLTASQFSQGTSFYYYFIAWQGLIFSAPQKGRVALSV